MTLSTPFDGGILWLHWSGRYVEEGSVAALADNIVRGTPNVRGVAVKSSNGLHWQGRWDNKGDLAVKGPESLAHWAEVLGRHGLELHLWCVLKGENPAAEARRVGEACAVAGVRSMLLDVEGGEGYFHRRQAAEARALIEGIRARVAPDFHLGLGFDARGRHPASIHVGEWLPHVQSLHPMVYHQAFGGGRGLTWWLEHILALCHDLAPEMPVVPMLGTFPAGGKPVAPQELAAGLRLALERARGVTLFRLGNAGAQCSPAALQAAIAACGAGRGRQEGDAGGRRATNAGDGGRRRRIGLNINAAESDRTAVLTHCAEARASSYLVMNDCGFAQKLHEHLGGESIVVARSDWPDDTTEIAVDELVSRWSKRAQYAPDVYHYFPNEPIPSATCPLPELRRRLIALMRACRERGVKACIGNFAVGTVIEERDVEAGQWDEFIREALRFCSDGGGFVGVHEYTFGVLPWGCAGRNPQDLMQAPRRVGDMRNWPTREEIEAAPGSNWHLHRSMLLAARAATLGLPMFPVLVTEFGWDRMPNLEHEGVIPWFDARYGRTHGPLQQVPRLSPQWFGEGCDALEVAMQQLRWAEAVYPDYVKGLHLFAWNENSLWREFNYAAWPGALEALARLEPARSDTRPAAERGDTRPAPEERLAAAREALAEIERQAGILRQLL